MFRKLDESPRIARLLEATSAWLARRRGLPIVLGIGLVVLAFIAQLIHLAAPAPALECIWAVALHVGLITALIGIALTEPLGR